MLVPLTVSVWDSARNSCPEKLLQQQTLIHVHESFPGPSIYQPTVTFDIYQQSSIKKRSLERQHNQETKHSNLKGKQWSSASTSQTNQKGKKKIVWRTIIDDLFFRHFPSSVSFWSSRRQNKQNKARDKDGMRSEGGGGGCGGRGGGLWQP